MSANLITFTDNNTFSTVGSYRILGYADPFTGVDGITGITDSVSGGNPNVELQRAFRWSRDGVQWSLWIDFTLADQSPLTLLSLNPDEDLHIEFKYTVIDALASPEIPEGTPISPVLVLNTFDLILSYATTDPYAGITAIAHTLCSDEFTTMSVLRQPKFSFDPYAVNKGIRLYTDLSTMVNTTFGWDVSYFKVDPQFRSKDVILHEWTLYNVREDKCFKVLVPNNEFPDSKPTYNQFGIDFEVPFEIHIDRAYWESVFGKNTMPQKRDIIYFPQTNRVYEVQSSYIFRDFMFKPLYFKVLIIKYQPKADQILPDSAAESLNALTLTTEELFGEEVKQQIDKITKPQQYVTITHTEDPIRAQVNRSLPIVRYDFYNNWTLIAEHYYNLAEMEANSGAMDAVIYREMVKMDARDNRSFACWFSPQPNINTFNSDRSLLRGRDQFGNGLDIDLVYSPNKGQSQIIVKMNATQTQFVLTNVTLKKDEWFAVVVNISNEFSQASVDLFEMMPEANTTELKKLYHKVAVIAPTVFDTGSAYRIFASQLLLTNIRLFNTMLEEEHQSIVLNQLIVKDSDKAFIIDNAKPLLRLARITNPK